MGFSFLSDATFSCFFWISTEFIPFMMTEPRKYVFLHLFMSVFVVTRFLL